MVLLEVDTDCRGCSERRKRNAEHCNRREKIQRRGNACSLDRKLGGSSPEDQDRKRQGQSQQRKEHPSPLHAECERSANRSQQTKGKSAERECREYPRQRTRRHAESQRRDRRDERER